MPLIATKIGLELNPETNEQEFVIRLVAQRKEDVPDLNAGDVWGETPLILMRDPLPLSTQRYNEGDDAPRGERWGGTHQNRAPFSPSDGPIAPTFTCGEFDTATQTWIKFPKRVDHG